MTIAAITLKRALVCAQFPADRRSILADLRKTGAPVEVLDCMEQLPQRSFGSAREVAAELIRHGAVTG